MKRSIATGLAVGVILLSAGGEATAAAAPRCSYKKTLKQGGTTFEVTSRPADGCAVQIISIVALRGGKPFAHFKADVDFLAREAWTADLDGDGRPELVVASAAVGEAANGTLDVYYFTGNQLRKASLPEMLPEERVGYQGHDTFRQDSRQIVRRFPVAADDTRSSATTRSLRYEFSRGVIAAVQPEPAAADDASATKVSSSSLPADVAPKAPESATAAAGSQPAGPAAAAASSPSPEPVLPVAPSATPLPADRAPAASDTTAGAGGPMMLRQIVSSPNRIEIQTSAAPSNVSHKKLYRPGRLVISLPGVGPGEAVVLRPGDVPMVRQASVQTGNGGVSVIIESTRPAFPVHTLTITDTGVRVDFPDLQSSPAADLPVDKAAPVAEAEGGRAAPPQKRGHTSVKGILTGSTDLLIQTAGRVATFKTEMLHKPERLVIDIPGALPATQTKKLTIGKFGIRHARIGVNKGFLRVVLNPEGRIFPPHKVSAADEGIRIEFPADAQQKEEPAAAVSATESAGQTHAPGDVPGPASNSRARNVSGIVAGSNYIEIVADGPIDAFKQFRLDNPERQIIDIPAGTTRLKTRAFHIGSFGIDKARIGLNKGFLRIVLDGSGIQPNTISSGEHGLRISFAP